MSHLETSERIPFPPGKFSVLYADPPWRYRIPLSKSRDIDLNHYPTMELEEICELRVPAADDCVLFLWTPSPMLQEGLEVMKSWGFRYASCAVWDKCKIGMGRYFRQQHELLLLGVRGKPGTPAPEFREPSVIRWPRGRHSAKPEIVYLLIEKMYSGPYLELFARPPFREGWAHWGNETYETCAQRFLWRPGEHEPGRYEGSNQVSAQAGME